MLQSLQLDIQRFWTFVGFVQSVRPVDFIVGSVKSEMLSKVLSKMLFEKPSSLFALLILSLQLSMLSLLSVLELLVQFVVLSFALLLCLQPTLFCKSFAPNYTIIRKINIAVLARMHSVALVYALVSLELLLKGLCIAASLCCQTHSVFGHL